MFSNIDKKEEAFRLPLFNWLCPCGVRLLVDLDDDAGTHGTATLTDSETQTVLDSDGGDQLDLHVDVIAGGAVRAVVEAAGIKNIRTKCLRTNNPANVVAATMEGLKSLRNAAQVAAVRGKTPEEIQG